MGNDNIHRHIAVDGKWKLCFCVSDLTPTCRKKKLLMPLHKVSMSTLLQHTVATKRTSGRRRKHRGSGHAQFYRK
jgi:hypothetical protein